MKETIFFTRTFFLIKNNEHPNFGAGRGNCYLASRNTYVLAACTGNLVWGIKYTLKRENALYAIYMGNKIR